MTVLVVDDTDSAREVAERILRFHGLDAVGARSGREALELLDRITPDVILLDISMPEMDGLQVLEILHQHERWSGIPVIMLTAVMDESTVRHAFELGVREYLLKAGISARGMLDIVKRHARAN